MRIANSLFLGLVLVVGCGGGEAGTNDASDDADSVVVVNDSGAETSVTEDSSSNLDEDATAPQEEDSAVPDTVVVDAGVDVVEEDTTEASVREDVVTVDTVDVVSDASSEDVVLPDAAVDSSTPETSVEPDVMVVVDVVEVDEASAPTCPSGETECSPSVCVNLANDVHNCGTCGNDIASGTMCVRPSDCVQNICVNGTLQRCPHYRCAGSDACNNPIPGPGLDACDPTIQLCPDGTRNNIHCDGTFCWCT